MSSIVERELATGEAKNVYLVIKSHPGAEKLNLSKSTVLKKSTGKKHESTFVRADDKEEIEDARRAGYLVVRVPRLRPLGLASTTINGKKAYLPNLGQTCTAEETYDQASKIDGLGDNSLPFRGKGVLIIAWDFVPPSNELMDVEEFKGRPGGPVKIYRNKSVAVANHGAQVCSIAGGKFGGPATEAAMVLLGLGENVLDDLEIISFLAKIWGGPVVVTMSFALEWEEVKPTDEGDIHKLMNKANDIMQSMTDEQNVLFLVASGNESVNLCEAEGPISFDNGSKQYKDFMCWPQFARKKETPFLQVGATKVQKGKRPLAIYSNYGSCVKLYTHGGVSCGWDTEKNAYIGTRGTSFACPLVAGVAAVLFSQDLKRKPSDILRILDENAISGVGDLPPGSLNKFMRVPQLKLGESPPTTTKPTPKLPDEEEIEELIGGNGKVGGHGKTNNISIFVAVLLLLGVVLLLLGVVYLMRKR